MLGKCCAQALENTVIRIVLKNENAIKQVSACETCCGLNFSQAQVGVLILIGQVLLLVSHPFGNRHVLSRAHSHRKRVDEQTQRIDRARHIS